MLSANIKSWLLRLVVKEDKKLQFLEAKNY